MNTCICMSHLYFFLSIKCSESYVIVQNSKGTFHPTEFHLPVGISKAFQFDLTCLNICRVILKFHLACDVKVDPCCVANLAVIVDSYRGWSHEISGNSQFFSLKREINKGQIISKAIFVFLTSPKKRTKTIWLHIS